MRKYIVLTAILLAACTTPQHQGIYKTEASCYVDSLGQVAYYERSYAIIRDSIILEISRQDDSIIHAEFNAGILSERDTVAVRKSINASHRTNDDVDNATAEAWARKEAQRTGQKFYEGPFDFELGAPSIRRPKPSPFIDPRDNTRIPDPKL